jgi:hypothetical protein
MNLMNECTIFALPFYFGVKILLLMFKNAIIWKYLRF